MVRLEDDFTREQEASVSLFTSVLNCVRIYNVPAINFTIIAVLGTFLLKLTTKYNDLYMRNSLVTIIVTNLVLYGISETLAQSILSFKNDTPAISIRVHERHRLLFNSSDFVLGAATTEPYNDEEGEVGETGEDAHVNRFLDFLNNPEPSYDLLPQISEQPVELTYYKFSRLAGFMCWGFVMAFVQCWWYKFLQIYSKDPKVVEVLRKVMSDMFCFSPISLFCFFTYGTMVLESGTWEDTKDKLRRIYLKTLMVQYSVWFPVQFVNFLLIPREFQVPFSSSVSVLWNCFLSMRNSTS